MNNQNNEIARQNLHSILKYRVVLSQLLKKPVTLEQAIADWLEHGHHLENGKLKPPGHSQRR